MLVVMLIDMSLIPLQITITSRMKDPISMQHERLRTVRTSEFNYFYICEFVSATETVGKFCSSLVGTDSLKLFVHQEIKLCPSGCNTSSRYVLVLRIRRWRCTSSFKNIWIYIMHSIFRNAYYIFSGGEEGNAF